MNGNGLIKIVSNSSDDLYIPINSIQHVQQGRSGEIIIKTNIDFELNSSVRPPDVEVLGYTLTEVNATQTIRNINGIIAAWESVLSGQETTSVVGFVVPIDSWTRTVNEWIL
jgi:hypothetical protein